MKVTGRCHCGQISFAAEVDPSRARVCHCSDCQKLSGSAFRANVGPVGASFRLTSGTPKVYALTADSGTRREHAFCPDCGTPIYSATQGDPLSYSLRIGTLDQRAALTPARQIWLRSALPWTRGLDCGERIEHQ